MSTELFTEAARLANKPGEAEELKKKTEQVNNTLLYSWAPKDPDGSVYSIFRPDTPFSTAQRLDPSEPTTMAAMWTGAVVNRSRRNYDEESGSFAGTNVGFREIWKATRLEKLADMCEENVENLSPKMENTIASVSIENIKKERIKGIESGQNEVLIFAGANGSGKDFMIGYLTKFLKFIKLDFDVHKMPNPDGNLFPGINQFLKGEKKIKPTAAQFLFLADAFDTEVSDGTLNIFNRHAVVEAMIYGPKELQTTVLSTHPLTNTIMHTMIIDRCALNAQDSVHKRQGAVRVFERNIEQVLHQRVRYAELTKLPGFRVINADFSGTDSEQKVRSVNRLLSTVLQIGVIQRQMLKNKMVQTEEEADNLLSDAYWKFKENKNIWLDKELNS